MNQLPLLILPLALLLTVSSCKKENVGPDGLVRATQQGKNTGDFLLEGKPFRPLAKVSTPGTKPVAAFWDHFGRGRNIQISFRRQERDVDRTEHSFNLFIANVKKPGTYQLTDSVNPFVVPGAQSSGRYVTPGPGPVKAKRYFLTGPASPGQVIITRFDTVARVVSGTFEARLREYDGPDALTITKGRFDCSF